MPKTFVPCFGGLGESQLWQIIEILRTLPNVDPWTPESTHDQYKTQLIAPLNNVADEEIVLLGHSLACDFILNLASNLQHRRLIFIEPVWAPKYVGDVPTLVLQSSTWLDFPKARVLGTNVQKIIVHNTTHNSICHVFPTFTAISNFLQTAKGAT